MINIVGDEAQHQAEEGFGRVTQISLAGVCEDEVISLLFLCSVFPVHAQLHGKAFGKESERPWLWQAALHTIQSQIDHVELPIFSNVDGPRIHMGF